MGTSDAISVLICDDHAVFRHGLALVLQDEVGIDVAAEAADGEDALRLVTELAPDVVLMDVRMPKVSGTEAARRMAEVAPSTRIVMLTVSDEEADLYEASKAGAAGYLLKEISIDAVAASVRAVATGQSLISPSMAAKLLSEFSALAGRAELVAPEVPAPNLTEREPQVLKLVAQGRQNREVAQHLFIAENTVKNHMRNILEKLRLHNRMEAVAYAVREKLFEIT